MKIKKGRIERTYLKSLNETCIHYWIGTNIFVEGDPIFKCKKCGSTMIEPGKPVRNTDFMRGKKKNVN